jgi:hypothetical protein
MLVPSISLTVPVVAPPPAPVEAVPRAAVPAGLLGDDASREGGCGHEQADEEQGKRAEAAADRPDRKWFVVPVVVEGRRW